MPHYVIELRTRSLRAQEVCVNFVNSVYILQTRRARPMHSALAEYAAIVKLARLQPIARWT